MYRKFCCVKIGYINFKFRYDMLLMFNLFARSCEVAVTRNMTSATVGGHMVYQSIYQHQATCHLPSFLSQSQSAPHILQMNNTTIRWNVNVK
jgi:hypothetical protein